MQLHTAHNHNTHLKSTVGASHFIVPIKKQNTSIQIQLKQCIKNFPWGFSPQGVSIINVVVNTFPTKCAQSVWYVRKRYGVSKSCGAGVYMKEWYVPLYFRGCELQLIWSVMCTICESSFFVSVMASCHSQSCGVASIVVVAPASVNNMQLPN